MWLTQRMCQADNEAHWQVPSNETPFSYYFFWESSAFPGGRKMHICRTWQPTSEWQTRTRSSESMSHSAASSRRRTLSASTSK